MANRSPRYQKADVDDLRRKGVVDIIGMEGEVREHWVVCEELATDRIGTEHSFYINMLIGFIFQ